MRANLDSASLRPMRDAMPYRVFHQWLQDQLRHARVKRFWSGLDRVCQAVLKTDLLDLQVTADELQFFVEAQMRAAAPVQRGPQEIAQPLDHVVGQLRIAAY